MVFWSWNPDVVVYVRPWPRFRFIVTIKKLRIIMQIMLLENISIVQIYATSICIMYAEANQFLKMTCCLSKLVAACQNHISYCLSK